MALHRKMLPDYAFQARIALVWGPSESIENWMWRSFEEEPDWGPLSNGLYWYDDDSRCHYVVIDTSKIASRKSLIRGCLSHEILHLTFSVLRGAGVRYCDASEEVFTYYFHQMYLRACKAMKI